MGWIESKKNLADLFTKDLPAFTRNNLVSRILDRWHGNVKKDEVVDIDSLKL